MDSDTGDLLWEWQTGNYVRASPVVIDGAVYIAQEATSTQLDQPV